MGGHTVEAEVGRVIDRYAEGLRRVGAIRSAPVEAAFRRVPRHALIPCIVEDGGKAVVPVDPANADHLERIYSNQPLVIRWLPAMSSSSQPSLMAEMLESLELGQGARVLEIGAGTGYNAALLAELVGLSGSVTTVDLTEELAAETRQRLASVGYDRVRVLARDGCFGDVDGAPYDRIVATASCSDLSPFWLEQLAADGRMLIPLAHGDVYQAPLTQIWRANGHIVGRIVGRSSFMAIRGELRRDCWLSEEETWKMQRLASEDTPQATRPLFPGFGPGPQPPRWQPGRDERYDFFYFLALQTRQTFDSVRGPGFGEESGFVVLAKDGVQLHGEQSTARYAAMERSYRQWEALGKPGMRDYALEFVALDAVVDDQRPDRSDRWAIDRRYFRQFVSLDAGNHPG
jgi:protein-L-isoaspartate(D-aspartate) O-methyltransferase